MASATFGVGHGLVALAGGDRAFRQEILESLPVRARVLEDGLLPHHAGAARRQGGPRPVGGLAGGGEVRRSIVVGGLQGRGIDLVQHLPGLDLRPFLEQAFLDDAAHLRTDLRHRVRGGPTRQTRW